MTIDMTFERREELIRKEEREAGRAEGKVEGKAEGKTEGKLELVTELLNNGDITPETADKIRQKLH